MAGGSAGGAAGGSAGGAAGGSAGGLAGGSAGGATAGGSAGGAAAGGSTAGGSAGGAAGGSTAGGSAGGPTAGGAASPDAGFVTVVYGHSSTTLYALDPVTRLVQTVGNFDCASDIIDLAIDSAGNAFITGFSGFHRLNLANASCTTISSSTGFPNSLSFVPRGTLDPTNEVLVAYDGRVYYRINTSNGVLQQIGAFPSNSGFESSGDIVSVQDGGTFLTVKNMTSSPTCNDCLVQVNPVTGALVRNYGTIPYANVWGIAYWGGSVYGFTEMGELFEIAPNGNGIITRPITIPNAPPGLSFYGAGSSTAVPVAAVDGGRIVID
jgi:hypothetical protein